jgi:Tol biopolymer transport system component
MTQEYSPSERLTFVDSETGATITQWTTAPCTNQHLYFTSYSVTSDDRWLTIISDRDGSPNLYAIDRQNGKIRRLSNNQCGVLHSYVYPQGGAVGFSKVSPCLDPENNRLFYIRDDRAYMVDLDRPEAGEQKIGELPAGWYGAYTHVSPDGKTFCVPCTDPRAFADEKTQWEQLGNAPLRMKQDDLRTRIYLIDVASGQARIAAEMPFWVTHVQFDPAGTGRIVFNLEGQVKGEGSPLPNRIWCLEPSGEFRPISEEPQGEWRSHENWSPDGQSIVYHGFRSGKAFVAARTWEGKLLHETSIDGIEFWHATGALDARRKLVDRRDGMISVLDPGATQDALIDLCRHDTAYDIQDAHAHPLTTPLGKSAIFTSNRSGHGQVYEVPLPSFMHPPAG